MVAQKPRSLMLIHNFRPGPTGGAEIQAERLARSLLCFGHPVSVLTNPISVTSQWHDFAGGVPVAPADEVFYGNGRDSSSGLDEQTAAIGDEVVGHIYRPPFSLAYQVFDGAADTFRFLIKNRNKYDILHCHFAYGHAVVAVVVARLLRKRCIIKIACAGEFGEFHNFSKFDGFSKALHVLHQADAMIAVSAEVEQELLRYGFSKDRIVRIPNGVDTDYFNPHYREEISNKVRFLFVGRRQPQKGVDLLLAAVQNLKTSGLGKKLEVQLCGVDSHGHDYQVMADRLGLSRLVKFLPFQKEMRQYYQEAQCFLLPSRGEGLSNALLEAMSM